jgi:hypothetical protein
MVFAGAVDPHVTRREGGEGDGDDSGHDPFHARMVAKRAVQRTRKEG